MCFASFKAASYFVKNPEEFCIQLKLPFFSPQRNDIVNEIDIPCLATATFGTILPYYRRQAQKSNEQLCVTVIAYLALRNPVAAVLYTKMKNGISGLFADSLFARSRKKLIQELGGIDYLCF